jgi:chemotaxis protein methyltransferase CheR
MAEPVTVESPPTSMLRGERALASAGITPLTFSQIAAFLKKTSGFYLSPEKGYLINTRLARIASEFGFSSTDDLAIELAKGADQALQTAVIEAMTTNETLFFRDGRPFETLIKVVIPALLSERGDQGLKILSAAASTGQEPYSIAMTLMHNVPQLSRSKWDILATDIDAKVLDKASAGVYSRFDVQRGVPTATLIKCFKEHSSGGWVINDEIKAKVKFKRANLLEGLEKLGKFDIVFCRNVLIYFDVPTKSSVLGNLAKVGKPGSFLFLGASETATGLSQEWVALPEARAVYKRS